MSRAVSRCAVLCPQAMLTWLRTFDMEAKLLSQLISLKARIAEATGNGLFSGGVHLGACVCGWVFWGEGVAGAAQRQRCRTMQK